MITAHHNVFGRRSVSTPLLLDTYPADLGFSLFKIRTAYTGFCIRVIRDSDNATLDIGFSGSVLDTAALLSFVGSANGYVERWYSQIGSNHVGQTTLANAPRIVNAGVLQTLNGHPSIYFDGVNDFLQLVRSEVVTTDFSVFAYGKRFASGSAFTPLVNGTIGPTLMQFADNNYYLLNSTGFNASISADTTANNILLEGHSTALARSIYKNQTLISSASVGGAFGNSFDRVMGPYSGTYPKGYLSEVLLYKTNQNANKTQIGNDIISRQS
jgi:hypothetical protein